MEKQLEELKAKMERSAGALANLEKDLDVINPEEKTNVFSARLLHLDNDLTAAEVDRAAKEAAYNAVKNGSLPAAEASEQGEQLRDLEAKLNEATEKFAEVKTQFGSSHPVYKKAAGQVSRVAVGSRCPAAADRGTGRCRLQAGSEPGEPSSPGHEPGKD